MQAFPAGFTAEEADPFLMCDQFGPSLSDGIYGDPDSFPIDWHPHRGNIKHKNSHFASITKETLEFMVTSILMELLCLNYCSKVVILAFFSFFFNSVANSEVINCLRFEIYFISVLLSYFLQFIHFCAL